METVRLALHAMATRFELVLHGENPVYLRAAGEEALAEIKRLESQLSFYNPRSDISAINACAAKGPVSVEPRLFELLRTAKRIYSKTEGALDITIGPLMRCWGFVNDTGQYPSPDALARARECTGFNLVHLDPSRYTIEFERPGIQIDLGGIGKGYAIDEAVASLQEQGITSGLLHGGTSTIFALGQPPNADAWKTAIPHPSSQNWTPSSEHILAIVELNNESLSLSEPSGKSFIVEDKEYGHVLDPRSGYPIESAALTATVASHAVISDSLSTALLVQGIDAAEQIGTTFNTRTLAASSPGIDGRFETKQWGIPLYHQPGADEPQAASSTDFYTHSTL